MPIKYQYIFSYILLSFLFLVTSLSGTIYFFKSQQVEEVDREIILLHDTLLKNLIKISQLSANFQSFFFSSMGVNANQFAIYANNTIKENNYITHIEYYPRISADEMQAFVDEQRLQGNLFYKVTPEVSASSHFPMLYIEPYTFKTAGKLGFDLASNSIVIEQIVQAAYAADLSVDFENSKQLLHFYIPTYRGTSISASGAARLKNWNGLVRLSINLEKFIQQAIYDDSMYFELIPEASEQSQEIIRYTNRAIQYKDTVISFLKHARTFDYKLFNTNLRFIYHKNITNYQDLLYPFFLCLFLNVLLNLILILMVYIQYNRARSEQQLKYQLTRQVAERTHDLREKNTELQLALEELHLTQSDLIEKQKMASLGNLVAGVAHEINTPLGISITAASHTSQQINDLIASVEKSDKQLNGDHDDIITAILEGHRILELNLNRAVELVKSFKQISVEQSHDDNQGFELINYIHDILISLKPRLKEEHVSIKITGDREIQVYLNQGVLTQILTNLILNSIVHAFAQTNDRKIEINLQKINENIQITYMDNGCGIPFEIKDQIFEPFFTTKRGCGGSGLGLHVIFNLVNHKLHGKVSCETVAPAGAKFVLLFAAIQGEE